MTERERVRQHFLDLPKTHRWPSASERPGNWYVRLDDAVAAVLAATPSVEPLDVERLATAISQYHRRSYIDMIDRLAAESIASTYTALPTQASDKETT